ncbi:hypothetical protein BHM03_00048127 [Ensete ventricosum]|nr:hypothetical protein BHM03_00048127 [Ensete ventricosum]
MSSLLCERLLEHMASIATNGSGEAMECLCMVESSKWKRIERESGKRGWAEAPSVATGWLAEGFGDSGRYSQENGVAEEQGDEEWLPPSLSTPT